ncbi:29175_t:CDS:10, partial [Gigaspora margarita]
KQEQRKYRELITEPTIFTPEHNRIISHAELPVVKNELSITLKIYLESHGTEWYTVFYKGRAENSRTPALWLNPNKIPCPRFSITGNFDAGINMNDYEFLLNRWYHIAYTLSNPDKRMNYYIDGEWVGSFSMTNIQVESFIFNDGPLYIGKHLDWKGFTGQISNFRYYNFRLSHNEGEDPTKHNNNDESPKKSFVGSTIGFFFVQTLPKSGHSIPTVLKAKIPTKPKSQQFQNLDSDKFPTVPNLDNTNILTEQRTYRELITEPFIFTSESNRMIRHAELPVVNNELSITLKIYLESHGTEWYTVFYKGSAEYSRTPALWLNPNKVPCPRFEITGNFYAGIDLNDYGFLLNKWYHIAYTLSNPDKRMNFYIDGEWVGSFSMTNIQGQSFIFNDGPLYIGRHLVWNGFTGQISNFRYYNFHLSHSEGEDPTKRNDNDDNDENTQNSDTQNINIHNPELQRSRHYQNLVNAKIPTVPESSSAKIPRQWQIPTLQTRIPTLLNS